MAPVLLARGEENIMKSKHLSVDSFNYVDFSWGGGGDVCIFQKSSSLEGDLKISVDDIPGIALGCW